MKHLLERLKKHDEESCLLRVEEWKHDEQKGEKGRRDLKRELCTYKQVFCDSRNLKTD